jgi:hypothetical protein
MPDEGESYQYPSYGYWQKSITRKIVLEQKRQSEASYKVDKTNENNMFSCRFYLFFEHFFIVRIMRFIVAFELGSKPNWYQTLMNKVEKKCSACKPSERLSRARLARKQKSPMKGSFALLTRPRWAEEVRTCLV